jgi:flagellar assembly protein FliH
LGEDVTTKVLTREAALGAQPIAWLRAPAGTSKAEGPCSVSRSEPQQDGVQELLRARIAELERELEEREQRAFSAGYRKGESAGQEQAAARLDGAAQGLARAAQEIGQARRKLRREAEEDLVRLAVAIARRILSRELSVDPEAVLGIVKAALDKLEAREVDRMRLNPEDAVVVRKHLEARGARVEIVEDERLERGAVVVETARGSLDASAETQLAEIERGLVDRIRR